MKILASSLRSLIVLAVSIAPSKLTSLARDWISELIPLRTSWAAIPLSLLNTLGRRLFLPKKL